MKKRNIFIVMAAVVAIGITVFSGCGGDHNQHAACTHSSLQKMDGKDATCYENGNYVYYKCECGELFSDKNAQRPTTLDDVTIEKLRHEMHRYEEQVGSHNGYYFCNSCGRYYGDILGENELPYGDFADSSVEPVALPDGWADPAKENAANRDFTIRCFIGWTNTEGKSLSEFPDGGTVWVNVNLNRKITLTGDGWYNFGVAYNKADGLQYKNFEAGNLTKTAAEFTQLFVKQGGIWVRVVRRGTNCSFYFEDKYGIPILISGNAHFDENEALYRFAFGQAEQVSGWTQSAANSQICWGIANPRCVFGKQ